MLQKSGDCQVLARLETTAEVVIQRSARERTVTHRATIKTLSECYSSQFWGDFAPSTSLAMGKDIFKELHVKTKFCNSRYCPHRNDYN